MSTRSATRFLLYLFLLSPFLAQTPSAIAQASPQASQPSHRERRRFANANDGRTRTYLLYIPQSLTKNHPAPLLLVFHRGGGHDYNMPRFTGFDQLADSRGFIIAYPESVKGALMGAQPRAAQSAAPAGIGVIENRHYNTELHV